MADANINPEVAQSIADISGARVAENSAETMPRHFWSALKNGHYRFALAGVAIAVPISLAIGAAFCALAGIGGAAAAVAVTGFVAVGASMGVESFGSVGSAAASRASGLAEKHARVLDADAMGKETVAAMDDKLMANGRGQHYLEPAKLGDKEKLYNWKSGLTGGAMGAASGAVIGAGAAAAAGHLAGLGGIAAAAAEAPILHTLAMGVAAAIPGALPIVALAIAGAAACAVFGLTFGIERHTLKSIFNQTDANINGNLAFKNGPDLGKAQSLESDAVLHQHRLRRQTEIDALEKSYNDRIAWGALTGRFRGFAAVVPGAAIGALAGAAVAGALALATAGGIAAVSPLIVPLFAAAGGMLAMKVMSESFMEAGAESTARAIDNEFERNRALRAQGFEPVTTKEPKQGLFSGKAAIICAVIGAVVGIALAPAVGATAIALFTGAHVAAFSAPAIGASMLISGMIGGTYGLTSRTLKAVSTPAMNLYDSVASPHPGAAKAPVIQQQIVMAQPCETVTAEDMAKINERTSAACKSKTFVKSLNDQQMQSSLAGLQA